MFHGNDEEVLEELEAVEAVYAGDVEVLRAIPPKLLLQLHPLTMEDATQQVKGAKI